MGKGDFNLKLRAICLLLAFSFAVPLTEAQYTATNLVQLRTLSAGDLSNATITLSPTGGDPHPETGVVTPGHYWINGDHIADPANTHPRFLTLGGTGNTYNLTGTTLNLDTRKLDGYGRNLGHDSGVDVVRIEGSNNVVNDVTLVGQDIALDTDPDAQRFADWATQYIELSGNNNTVDGAHVVTRGSRTDTYGLGDAFGKGSSQGIQPYIGHRKASAFRVGEATGAVVNDIHIEVYSFGHGFFVQQSTDTTLTNSTITGELFSTNDIIARPEYQQYGHTYWGNPIPPDQFISGAEDGVRMYTGASGLTVDNVVVDGMRSGFATRLNGGQTTLSNVAAYNTEAAFEFRTDATITNAIGNAVHGPLIFMDSSNSRDSSIEVELVGDQPINHDYAIAYVSGNNVDVTINSTLPVEYFGDTSLIRSAQFWYENWREADDFDKHDYPGYDHIDSVIHNSTNQVLVLGTQAEGNVGSSLGPVYGNGKENYYDGLTLVPSGTRLVVEHTYGLGNDGTEVGAEFAGSNIVFNGTVTAFTPDDNGTVVQAGATLEIAPGIQVDDERVTISGHGVDGQGAIYTEGTVDSGTRLVGSGELIILAGDASIGVGIAGNQFLADGIAGEGNLTKLGPGKLSVGTSSVFDGDLIIAEGELIGRRRVVHSNLTVNAGATASALANFMIETPDGIVTLNGTFDTNVRTDSSVLPARLGGLEGSASGLVTSSNPSPDASGILQIVGEAGSAEYQGQIEGAVFIEKWGDGTQILSGANTYAGTTTVTDGTLLVNGTHTGGDTYTVTGGILGGGGLIDTDITVEAGGTLAPGASAGRLTVEQISFETGATLEIEIGGITAGTEYDQLMADSVSLAGDLAVSLLDLGGGVFLPGPGDTFIVVVGTDLTGIFDNIANGARLDTTGGEGSFLVAYDDVSDAVMLSDFSRSTSSGDFDFDGDVDGADFLFRQQNGLSTAELLDWQNEYGRPSSLIETATVPEPTTLLLATAACNLTLVRRRR